MNILALIFFQLLFIQRGNAFVQPKQHHHQGKVTPFRPGKPEIQLDTRALDILNEGKPYQTQTNDGSTGRALCIQDIHAPPSVIWDRILDYDHYAEMVPNVIESHLYTPEPESKQKSGKPQVIHAKMKIGFPPLVQLTYYIKHLYFQKENSLTWTLDYSKPSDFDDTAGFWYVMPHPSKEDWSRVFYSIEVIVFDWIPKFIKDLLCNKALTDATEWVKKESEKQFELISKVMQEQQLEKKKKKQQQQPTSQKRPKIKKILTNLAFWDKKKDDETAEITSSAPKEEKEERGNKPLFDVLFWDKKKHDISQDISSTEKDTTDSSSCTSNQEEKSLDSKMKEEELVVANTRSAGMGRAGLVFLTFVLFLYNVGLFLERMSLAA